MLGARTRGHAPALEAVAAMLRGGAPHAILISGPPGVGKTTLAFDLAAGLLCQAADPGARPCRDCRGCRLLAAGTHTDLHWLRPEGKGGQILVGDPDDSSKPRGVRDLLRELALLPIEGGARVAIIDNADRMNDPAQGAILKTLEEPPSGVTVILTADEETRLATTIRSRCARIRLGPVASRDVETVLAEQGVDDPAVAARLARLLRGRPGVALTYARAPDALRIRGELVRVLLDLTAAGPAERLAAMRTAIPAAMALGAALDAATTSAASAPATGPTTATTGRRTTRSGTGRAATPRTAAPSAAVPPSDGPASDVDGDGDDAETQEKGPGVSQRRRAAETMVLIWVEVARDLALVQAGGRRSVRDLELLEELELIAAAVPSGAPAQALVGLERAATLLAANVSPELVLDATVLAWPVRSRAA